HALSSLTIKFTKDTFTLELVTALQTSLKAHARLFTPLDRSGRLICLCPSTYSIFKDLDPARRTGVRAHLKALASFLLAETRTSLFYSNGAGFAGGPG
ncbi:MAG: hypothetical protein RMK57_17125, partial [Bryobacterales bacterium]|nr:hypothetical protein [Bryobacterales bacterium]